MYKELEGQLALVGFNDQEKLEGLFRRVDLDSNGTLDFRLSHVALRECAVVSHGPVTSHDVWPEKTHAQQLEFCWHGAPYAYNASVPLSVPCLLVSLPC